MDSNLIKRYFKGQCTIEEAVEFLKWMKSKKSEQELSDFLDSGWEELDYDFATKSSLLQQIHKAIDDKDASQNKNNGRAFVRPFFKIAASVALAMLSIYVIYILNSSHSAIHSRITEATNLVVKSTDMGQKLRINLPDGSTVLLNALSEITYPSNFSDTLRWVELTGEAFFEVEKDDQKPFIIKTADLSTRVLGTSFNVRHRFGENQTQVALLSGSISINILDEKLLLEPGDLAVFDRVEERLVKGKWDYKKDFGWKDGILYFDQATLEEVKEKLEIWYGVRINISNDTDRSRHFTGSFKNESLRNVMESLSFTFGFTYHLKDQYVVVKF